MLAGSTGGWGGTEETRDYLGLGAGLRKAYDGKARPVLMVPVGDVLLELHERMRVGKVLGFTGIPEVYMDSVQFNNVGSLSWAHLLRHAFPGRPDGHDRRPLQ